ncbi:MAG: hypothetical protein WC551_10620 [Patescibacteria group bacterium]
MTKLQMLVVVRDLIRERLGTGQTQGNWNNSQLFRYIDQGVWDAFHDEIDADKTRFNERAVLTSVGTEFFTLPTDYVRHKTLALTADLTLDSYNTYTEIAPDDREDGMIATPRGRGFYFYSSTQIGVRPIVTSGETLTLTYFKKFAELDDEGKVKCNLHEMAQFLACLYATRMALIDRGDAVVRYIDALISERKSNLHNIRRSSHEPYRLVAS